MDDESLNEYIEYKNRLTSFETQKEFNDFCSTNFCFYPAGFGAWIEALIETEEQFFDFIQKAKVDHIGGETYPDWRWWLENEYINVDGFDIDTTDDWPQPPTKKIVGYQIDYNPYMDEPYEFFKVDELEVICDFYSIHMAEKLKNKLPFIARFCDVDTFDRAGSIKGTEFVVISFADYKVGQINFR